MEQEKEFVADDAERLLSIEEVGERLGTGRAFAARLVNAGLIASLSFRRIKRVPKSELARFVQKYAGQDVYLALEETERKQAQKGKGGLVDFSKVLQRKEAG